MNRPMTADEVDELNNLAAIEFETLLLEAPRLDGDVLPRKIVWHPFQLVEDITLVTNATMATGYFTIAGVALLDTNRGINSKHIDLRLTVTVTSDDLDRNPDRTERFNLVRAKIGSAYGRLIEVIRESGIRYLTDAEVLEHRQQDLRASYTPPEDDQA